MMQKSLGKSSDQQQDQNSLTLGQQVARALHLQGITKETFPDCVNVFTGPEIITCHGLRETG